MLRAPEARLPGAVLRRFPPGGIVLREGEPPWAVGVVVSGALVVRWTAPSGRRAALSVLGAGRSFGLEAVLEAAGPVVAAGDDAVGATAEAPEDRLPLRPEVRAWIGSQVLFVPIAHSRPARPGQDASAALLSILAGEIGHLQRRLAATLTTSATERLLELLLDLARDHGRPVPGGVRIRVPLTQDLLACATGITRESVNRALRRLRSDGLVRRAGRSYVVSTVPVEPTGSAAARGPGAAP